MYNLQVCVPADQVCDFANDCGDNTDELETICYLKKPRFVVKFKNKTFYQKNVLIKF